MHKFAKKQFFFLLALAVVGLGIVAGVMVTGQGQDIRNRATENPDSLKMCSGSKLSAPTLAAGQTIEMKLSAKLNVKIITLSFYNVDNLDADGKPKAIAFSSGTPFTLEKTDDKGIKKETFQIAYADLAKPDVNNDNQFPANIKLQGTFANKNGTTSIEESKCTQTLTLAVPTPTLTPTTTPTGSATPTMTPTNTPTNTPINTPTRPPSPTSGVGGFRPTPTPTRRLLPTLSPTPRVASPSPSLTTTPFPTVFLPSPTPEPPVLLVNPFTNSKGEAPATFTLSGSSSPNAQITIEIMPDGIFGTATADENGQWRYIVTQKLSAGKKELRITATDTLGTSTTNTQSFTVTKAGFGAWIWTILGLGVAILIFIIVRSRMNQPPPYIPPTPGSGDSSPFVPQQPVDQPVISQPTSIESTSIDPNLSEPISQ